MTRDAYVPYAPLNRLKAFADEVWIADGPEIGMKYLGGHLPFPTRMTVVRLSDGGLWVHSPIAWDDGLGAQLQALGPVRHLIAPNTLHYWHLPAWQARFPEARTYGAPDLQRRARRALALDETLGEAPPAAWDGLFDQCLVRGPVLSEADFLHRPTRTLILADLIENFEPRRVRRPLLRWLVRLSGAMDPDGKAPLDMRLTFRGRRAAVRDAAERMLSWEPRRIILAHGRCYDADGAAELRRAFRWAL